MTPEGLRNCGDWIDGTKVRFHYGAKHMIVVSKISKSIIESALHSIDSDNEIYNCTLPIE